MSLLVGSCVTSNAGPCGECNCTRDGGGPFGFGNQVLISSHRELLSSKAMVVLYQEDADLVVQGIEAIAGCLRFRVQRRLQFLNTFRS
jgi:hypothetical protein